MAIVCATRFGEIRHFAVELLEFFTHCCAMLVGESLHG
jgi:hypothetical protein